MVRCRAKGENYSYDFAASLQNTNGQSILISERDLTAWKGAAERMLTNEIVLKVFSDYLARDDDFEVVLTSKGRASANAFTSSQSMRRITRA